jgi:hypothetical protein
MVIITLSTSYQLKYDILITKIIIVSYTRILHKMCNFNKFKQIRLSEYMVSKEILYNFSVWEHQQDVF